MKLAQGASGQGDTGTRESRLRPSIIAIPLRYSASPCLSPLHLPLSTRPHARVPPDGVLSLATLPLRPYANRMSAGCRLILALDVETKEEALALARPLAGNLAWVKLGLQLFTRHGPGIVDEFHALGFKVFLDLKLHDIPNTVASAVKSLKGRPCSLLTLHAAGGPEMIARAREAADLALPDCQLLSVTVLTSMDQAQLNAIGVQRTPEEQVRLLGRLAIQAGSHGLVCSPLELPVLRADLGPGPALVTPGIRYPDAAGDDQNRVMTPAQAAAAGASFIVVGRPILKDKDPAGKTLSIRREIGEAK